MSHTADRPDTRTLLEQAEREVRGALPASAAHFARSEQSIPGGTARSRFWWPVPIYMARGRART